MAERRHDIDWLRVLVMLAVFVFHCARFFGGGTWHLNSAEQSFAAMLFIGWLDMWFMPLFCLLSGVGAWYALGSRDNGRFLLERVKRILVPLYTVGLFVLLPPQFYFEIVSNHGYRGTLWATLPRYFRGLADFSLDWPGGVVNLPFSGHLWFLQYLFLISVLALPLLRHLRSDRGRRLIGGLARLCVRPGGIFLVLVPVLLVRIGLRSVFHGEHTWADFLEFLVFFVIGYVLTADPRFTESIRKHGRLCLVLGVLCFAVEGLFVVRLGYGYPGGEPFSILFVLFEAAMSVGRWSWIVFVLSLGAKHLDFESKLLAYGNEAVLPWNVGIPLKLVTITLISFAIIMAVYELGVRRFRVMRFLFGMRPKARSKSTPTPRKREAVL